LAWPGLRWSPSADVGEHKWRAAQWGAEASRRSRRTGPRPLMARNGPERAACRRLPSGV